MITPRTTRLVRAADLRSFRNALAVLATEGSPFDARDRLVLVPTRAASLHLQRSIENRMAGRLALVLPDFATRDELHRRLFERIDAAAALPAPYTDAEREALLTVACRAASAAGAVPPFHVRPGLIAAMLEFYDTLRRHQKSVDDFERLTLGRLEGIEHDRGAERQIRQTRFFVAAFREFERRCTESGGVDEHTIRGCVLSAPAERPWRHIVVAVRDRAGDRYGLYPVDWDLLARVPRLDRLDVVITDTALAGSFHERIHQWLPGIEEVAVAPSEPIEPIEPLEPIEPSNPFRISRDREEEIADFAQWVRKRTGEADAAVLDRTAIVVRQRLPYVYLSREVLRAAGIPCQMFDALPLAAEPYAAAVDLLFSFISSNSARSPAIALLRSPQLAFSGEDGAPIREGEVAALDRALSEGGFLGGLEGLSGLIDGWERDGSRVSKAARRGAVILRSVIEAVAPLCGEATIAAHLDRVIAFLNAHESLPGPNDPLRSRQLRARGAVLGLMRALRDAYLRFDTTAVSFDEVAAMVRRAIDAQTFAPRSGETGVHLLDADSAPFGDFDYVQLAGLVDGEWPDRPRRNIFYSPAILRDLGWPSDAPRVEGVRSAFADLLRLPGKELVISAFALENDSIVGPSMMIDDVAGIGLEGGFKVDRVGAGLKTGPYSGDDQVVLPETARAWAASRLGRPSGAIALGQTRVLSPRAYSVSSLERYQDCPFKYFAADVLQLEEQPEGESALSPRARGRFIHEVFQRFFEQWDRGGGGTITSDNFDSARALFAQVAEPLLGNLPEADAGLERARLFGSAISVGIVDVVLGLEATRPVDVTGRWLEYRLDGEFRLGDPGGRAVTLRGVADRIDLLAGHRLRVIDYKSGYAPQPKRALQVPIYALCAQERLAGERGDVWQVDEGAYVAFAGKRSLVAVIKAGREGEHAAVLADARTRTLDIISAIERGEFPPRPHDPRICSYCAYPSVCRKDYVGD